MKKLALIFTMGILSLNMASAGNGNLVHDAIAKQLKTPSHLKTQTFNGIVQVQFKIDKNGKVSIMNVKTSNSDLKSYLIEQFSRIHFNSLNEKEMIYNVNINFKIM